MKTHKKEEKGRCRTEKTKDDAAREIAAKILRALYAKFVLPEMARKSTKVKSMILCIVDPLERERLRTEKNDRQERAREGIVKDIAAISPSR